MKLLRLLLLTLIFPSSLASSGIIAQTTLTIGTGTSSSSTRGPFQRADTNSTTVFSRFVQVYTASELATAGLTAGASITQLNWELASSNVIIGSGDATLKIYIKNSSATQATADTWANLTAGSTLVLDDSYNTNNNFPGANGWMPFSFSAPFTYTGGALEIAVDWDCSQVSTPAFSGNGAIKFRWSSTAPDNLVVKKTSSSSPSSSISDLKDERANIQIVFSVSSCGTPSNLNASNITSSSADLSWTDNTASSYFWKVVPAGAASATPALDSGTTMTNQAMAMGLMELTSYDFYVESDCGAQGSSPMAGPYTFLTLPTAQLVATIGTGSSSSSTRGPFQRSDTNSSTVFSRFVQIYTATELANAGITSGTEITQVNWELASSNVIIGSGDAPLKVYIKNSSTTTAASDSWANLISGSSLVVDQNFNTVNNFPGANGWMPFAFTTPFTYTGGSIEIAVDWDCSQVSTPAFSGNGAIKWRWESTAPEELVVKKTASSSPPSTISDVKDERANIQFVYVAPICEAPISLNVSNITDTSADFSWTDTAAATAFAWRVVPNGADVSSTAVDSGMTSALAVTSTSLPEATALDLYVGADCGSIVSEFAGPFTFTTQCADVPPTTISTTVTSVSCNGGSDGAIDLSVTAGVPGYRFQWSNEDTTEDISGLMAGTYTITITDGNGCPYLDSVVIEEPDALGISFTSSPDSAGTGLGEVSVTLTGGTPPYTLTWDGSPGLADSTGLSKGTYLIQVTDDLGCTDTASVFVDDLVGINSTALVSNFTLAPNPTRGIVSLSLRLQEATEGNISIFSLQGHLIHSWPLPRATEVEHQIDLRQYPAGIYLVKVQASQQVQTQRIMLQR